MANQQESRSLARTLSGSLASSLTAYERLRGATGEPITATQLSEQLMRLTVVFGEPKAKSDEQLFAMAKEWHTQLKRFGAKTVEKAVSEHIRESKWWPTIADIFALCRKDDESWRDTYGILHVTGQPAFKSPPREMLPPEVLAARAAAVARMKAEAGFDKPEKEIPIGGESAVKASQDTAVSPMLLGSCAARRARGLDTCQHDCSRRSCELRQ